MINTNAAVAKLFSIRNQYGKEATKEKLQLLGAIKVKNIKGKKNARALHGTLLFLQAYPDDKAVYQQAGALLKLLVSYLEENETLQYSLYNTGVSGTTICAAFSFEMVKWLRKTKGQAITFNSFESNDEQIQLFISIVMSKAESEILQDGNAEWKTWLKKMRRPGEDSLGQLIAIFDSSTIRPEVKDEIWNAMGINVEIHLASGCSLPASLCKVFYHRGLIKKETRKESSSKPIQFKLTEPEAEHIIDCSRMILIRHLREIDPISFTSAKLISYYHLQRGISIALIGIAPERRHPIDSYISYVVFKNGLPVSYGASWILFNSGRIGINVFPDYRGGEARYIFKEVTQLYASVYNLKRFTVDPYQIGKDNSDAINSGAFWVYYHAGFRPMEEIQRTLAATEANKIKANKKHRSSAAVLKILAQSRLELVLQEDAFCYDATDMSRAYAGIITKKYKGDRLMAEKDVAKKLASILQIKNYHEANMNFVLQNWAVFLLCKEKELTKNDSLKKILKGLFSSKATDSEEAYISGLQNSVALRKLLEELITEYASE